jgi:hypothetical protein
VTTTASSAKAGPVGGVARLRRNPTGGHDDDRRERKAIARRLLISFLCVGFESETCRARRMPA